MKKSMLFRFAALILALLMFSLTACSGGGKLVITGDPDETEETAEVKDKPEKTYSVDQPYTRAMLDEIPVSNSSMSSDELRAICLRFARMQGTLPWISSKSFSYILENGLELKFDKDVVYGGCPYTNAGSSLYTYMDYVDEKTGLLDESVVNRVGETLGNNCCSALFWAWSRVSSTITFTHTQGLVPKTNMIPLGDYKIDPELDSFRDKTTGAICKENGAQKMFECYAKLLLADGMVVNNQSDGTVGARHHVMMVSKLPEVVRNDDGTINGKESFLTFVEQDEVLRPYTLENGMELQCEGHIDSRYSFENLFNTGYIPFTIPELVNPSSVQKAVASISRENGATVTTQELRNAVVSTNYALSKLIIKVKVEDGTTKDFSSYVSGVAKYEAALGQVCVSIDRQLEKGSYEIEIRALVGSGETVPVFTGTLVKE